MLITVILIYLPHLGTGLLSVTSHILDFSMHHGSLKCCRIGTFTVFFL